jgi:hypothetical protein
MQLIRKTRVPLLQLFMNVPLSFPSQPDQSEAWPLTFTSYEFPVHGQGAVSFTLKANQPFRIVLASQIVPGGTVLALEVGSVNTTLRADNGTSERGVIQQTTDPKALLDANKAASYWLSVDSVNGRVRFGKGEMLPQFTVFEVPLMPLADAAAVPTADAGAVARPATEEPLRALRYIGLAAPANQPLPEVLTHFLWPVPVVLTPSPRLLGGDAITLEHLARNDATTSVSLPSACQALYGSVAGAAIELDTPDFPDFSAAIDHSIVTPGCICYERLREKAGDFGNPDIKETYLRITFGPNQAESPGSPFVLEIWPGNHYSPVHDHGNACAVIKVLHGDIWIELYPDLHPKLTDYFEEALFHKGDVTYLTPGCHQVHRLVNHNPSGRMTATFQCYRYPDDDVVHWEYFDYIADGEVQPFEPNSDWQYLEFREMIRAEWQRHTKSWGVYPRPIFAVGSE